MIKTTSTLLFVGLAAAAAGPTRAADVDISKLPPAAKQKGVTYAKDIQPILQTTCFGCHGEQRHKGGLRLDSLEAALKGGEDGKVIVPGQSAKSPMVIAVARLDEETAMPPMKRGRGGPGGGPGGPGSPGGPGGPEGNRPQGQAGPGGPPGGGRGPGGPPPKPLTPEQVGLIRAWIDQGAK